MKRTKNMIQVEVLFFGPLREIFQCERRKIRLGSESRIDDVVQKLMEESEKDLPRGHQLLYALNENFQSGDAFLKDQDTLALMTPVSGG